MNRERIQEIIARIEMFGHGAGYTVDEVYELTRMALAAMDSEPVAWKVRFKLEGQPGSNFNKFFENRKAMNDVVSLHELGGFNFDVTPLYRHAQQPVALDGLIKAVEFYEQVKRENPPVETGAWKDAVDWVLKEACRAARLNGGKP